MDQPDGRGDADMDRPKQKRPGSKRPPTFPGARRAGQGLGDGNGGDMAEGGYGRGRYGLAHWAAEETDGADGATQDRLGREKERGRWEGKKEGGSRAPRR
jgi:hypothetical protein